MDWLLLIIAGVLETLWAIGLKYCQGFTRFWPSVVTISIMIVSMSLLAWSVRTIPVGTGYAIWTGIGALGTAVFGIWLLNEPATGARIFFLAMILIGMIGLKWTAP